MAHDEKSLERVPQALSGRRDVVEKRLMGGLCFMVAGRMCCSVSGKEALLVRVSADTRGEALAQPHARPMEMGARTMNGFVRVSPEGYRTEAALKRSIARGLNGAAARALQANTRRKAPPRQRKQ